MGGQCRPWARPLCESLGLSYDVGRLPGHTLRVLTMSPGCLEAHVCVSYPQPYKAGALVPLLWGGRQEAQRPQVLAWEHTAGHRRARLKAVLQTSAQSCPLLPPPSEARDSARAAGSRRGPVGAAVPARWCSWASWEQGRKSGSPSLESQVRLCPWAAFRTRRCDARGISKTDPIRRQPADGVSVEHGFSRVSGRSVPGPRVRAGGRYEGAGLGTGPGCRQEEVGSFHVTRDT